MTSLQAIHEATGIFWGINMLAENSFPLFSPSHMQDNLSFTSFLSNFWTFPLIKRQHLTTNVPRQLNFENAGWPSSQCTIIFSKHWKYSFLPRISISMRLLSKYLIILSLLLKLLQPYIPLPPHTHTYIYVCIYRFTGPYLMQDLLKSLQPCSPWLEANVSVIFYFTV